MIGVSETFLGRIAAVIVRFPGIVRGDARHFVELSDVGGWVAVDRSRRRGNDIDLVLEDEFVREFRGPALVGLAVLGDELDLVGLATDLKAGLQRFTNAVERPILRFGETGHWTGLRADVADLDRPDCRHAAPRARKRRSKQVLQRRPAKHCDGTERISVIWRGESEPIFVLPLGSSLMAEICKVAGVALIVDISARPTSGTRAAPATSVLSSFFGWAF